MNSKKDDSGKYWPYMILGFLFIGLTLGYWTIKNTISLPVHQSNDFMQSYQDADANAIKIKEAEVKFDAKYNIEFSGLEKSNFKPKHIKRKAHLHYRLNDVNSFSYIVTTKDGSVVDNAEVTFVLTRPQTELDDKKIGKLNFKDGKYWVENLKIDKKGRYILRVKVKIGDAVKYLDTYGIKL